MRPLFSLLPFLVLVACATDQASSPADVAPLPDVADVNETDGAEGTDSIDRTDATSRPDSTEATDGPSGTDTTDGTDTVEQTDGTDRSDGAGGTDGTDGTDESAGTDGSEGSDSSAGSDGTDALDGTDATDGTEPPAFEETPLGSCDDLVAPWELGGAEDVLGAFRWSGPDFGLLAQEVVPAIRDHLQPGCPAVWEETLQEDPWQLTIVLDAGEGCSNLLGAWFEGKATLILGNVAEHDYTFDGFRAVLEPPGGAGTLELRADGTFSTFSDPQAGVFDMSIDLHYRILRSGSFAPPPGPARDGDIYQSLTVSTQGEQRTGQGYVYVITQEDGGRTGDFCTDFSQTWAETCPSEADGSVTISSAKTGTLTLGGSETCDTCADAAVDRVPMGQACGFGLSLPQGGG